MTPEEVLGQLATATSRLMTTVGELDAGTVDAPSLLPGWRRAHVLSHIARNADGLRNLLLAARSGHVLQMYANPATRDADIAAGATRPADVVLADVIESSRRFAIDANTMPHETWSAEVLFTSGQPNPSAIRADRCLSIRLAEVEIHHVDLATDYSFDHTPATLAEQLLGDLVQRNGASLERESDGQWVTVVPVGHDARQCRGSTADLLAWFSGRSSGTGVKAAGGALPELAGFG